jgi:hypothetical protein
LTLKRLLKQSRQKLHQNQLARMDNNTIHPSRRLEYIFNDALSLRAGDSRRYSSNALFNSACRNCPQRLRLALTVAST